MRKLVKQEKECIEDASIMTFSFNVFLDSVQYFQIINKMVWCCFSLSSLLLWIFDTFEDIQNSSLIR